MSKWTALAEQIHKTSEMAGLGSAQSARSPENRLVALVAPLGSPVSEVANPANGERPKVEFSETAPAANDDRQQGLNVPPAAPTIAPDEPGNLAAGVMTREAEARRRRVLNMLAERPDIRYAVVTDTQADPEAVILALAIRGQATCELRIPRDRYDPFLLLDLIERHGGTIH